MLLTQTHPGLQGSFKLLTFAFRYSRKLELIPGEINHPLEEIVSFSRIPNSLQSMFIFFCHTLRSFLEL